jgi:uncharacterized protein (TIGR02594 family)
MVEKWHQNPAVQAIFSVFVFASISAIIFGLVTVFWSYLTAYREAKTRVVVNITSEQLLQASKSLRSKAQSLRPSGRNQAVAASNHLEGAASETKDPHFIILKSAASSAPVWLQIALSQLSQKEISGIEHNQQILHYIYSIEPDAIYLSQGDELPWASSFVNWTIERAKMVGTDSDNAHSWLDWGKAIEKPRPGAIAVFKLEQHPAKAYVGIFLAETANYVIVVGGDMGNAVRVVSQKKADLLGYRWPDSPSPTTR